jgi:hypothetical protein
VDWGSEEAISYTFLHFSYGIEPATALAEPFSYENHENSYRNASARALHASNS